MYCGYEINFHSADSWTFDSDTARNVIIFGVDNSSSSHGDNRKNNVLVLGEVLLRINGSFGSPNKKFSISFVLVKQKQICVWVCIIMLIIVICVFMKKKPLSLKPTAKLLTFQLNFVSEVYLMDLVLVSLEKYLWMDVSLIFHSIKMLLINLIY